MINSRDEFLGKNTYKKRPFSGPMTCVIHLRINRIRIDYMAKRLVVNRNIK
jgi:hypothetical protein